MTSPSENHFFCDEAVWLGAEIRKFAEDTGFAPENTTRLQKIGIRLAEEVFAKNEICLAVSFDDIAFLRDISRSENPILSEDFTAKTPLVFDEHTVPAKPALYFRKQFVEETFIAQTIRDAAKTEDRILSPELEKIIKAGTENGFGFSLSDEQQNAVRTILKRRFTIISGGPGTGKTTLLLRALICLLMQNGKQRIEIAAPTGKAATRIRESVSSQIVQLDSLAKSSSIFQSVFETISQITPKTLHRLLGISATNTRPRNIFADIVIIDEASMISQTLMATLLRALPTSSRLVLLGDKNQLDSVEPGHIFGDFYSAEVLERSRVSLEQSHRFDNRRFIGKLAASVLRGDSESVLAMLTEPNPENCELIPCSVENRCSQTKAILEKMLPIELKNPPHDADPKILLNALGRTRILTPMTEGPFGKNELNTLAQALFAPNAVGEHFHGRPILITQNAPEQSLSNGDTGIILRSRESETSNFRFVAWFLDECGNVRKIPASSLPPHETAYAMTIHKSQGSEFSRLALFFPKTTHREFYSRQLLYTAITRFKETDESRFALIFDKNAVSDAVRSGQISDSLLAARIDSEK